MSNQCRRKNRNHKRLRRALLHSRFFLTIGFGLLLFAGVEAQPISIDEYSVYSAVLRELAKKEKEEMPKTFVILDQTMILDEIMMSDSRDAASRDFRKKNKASFRLEARLHSVVPIFLVAEKKVKELIEKSELTWKEKNDQRFAETGIRTLPMCGPDWNLFDEVFPEANGYYQFSRVGFNRNKTRAMVQIAGNGAGWDSNQFFVFKKSRGRWRIHSSGGGFNVC